MRSPGTTILAAMLLSSVAFAEDWQADDFAFGFTVEADAGEAGPLLNLELPDAVYRGVVRADMGDIRVFNGAGEIVPHALRRPLGTDAEAPAPRELPFFLLHREALDSADTRVLRIVTDDQGTIVSAASAPLDTDAAKRVIAYLVDASALDKGPNRLVLDWKMSAAEGFAVTVDVLASDDLSHWKTLVSDVTLADLRSPQAALLHNEIALPGHKVKYLRIDWPEAMREAEPTRIMVHFAAEAIPPPRKQLELLGTWQDDDGGGWIFDTEGYRPIDRARVLFNQPNVLLRGRLLSRAAPDSPWRHRHAGAFYSLERAGARLENEPVSLDPTTDRYWRFAVESAEVTPTRETPKLEIGWIPHRLMFVARGIAPYTVAFGNATAPRAEHSMKALLRDVAKMEQEGLSAPARASSVFILGGEEKRRPPPPPLAWRTWLLWGVLLAGVLLLALMVRSLLAQLGASNKSEGADD